MILSLKAVPARLTYSGRIRYPHKHQAAPLRSPRRLLRHLVHEIHRPPQRLQPLVQRAAVRLQAQSGDAGVAVLADALTDHVFGAEEVRLEDELVGHERGSPLAVAFEPAVLDGDRLLVVAGAAEGGVVEVVALGAHRAE